MSTGGPQQTMDAVAVFKDAVEKQLEGVLSVTLDREVREILLTPSRMQLARWRRIRKEIGYIDVLVYEGILSELDAARALREARKLNQPIEEYLLAEGQIDDSIHEAVRRRQVVDQVASALADGTEPAFREEKIPSEEEELEALLGGGVLSEVVASPGDVITLLEAAEVEHDEVTEQLGGDDAVLVASPDVKKLAEENPLQGHVIRAAALCNGENTLAEVVQSGAGLPPYFMYRALASLLQVEGVRRADVNELLEKAAGQEQAGHYDRAYALYQAAFEEGATDFGVLEKLVHVAEIVEDRHGLVRFNSLLGEEAQRVGDEKTAVRAYEAVVRHDSSNFEAQQYLFEHAHRYGVHDVLARCARELVRLNNERGDFDVAKRVARRALKAVPTDVRLLEALAKTHMLADESQDAVAVYEEILKVHERAGSQQAVMNVLMTIRRLAPDRQDIRRRIEASHLAEQRRRRILIGSLVTAAVLVIGLGSTLLVVARSQKRSSARGAALHVAQLALARKPHDVRNLKRAQDALAVFQEDWGLDSELERLAEDLVVASQRAKMREETGRLQAEERARVLLDEALALSADDPPRLDAAWDKLVEASSLLPVSADQELQAAISQAVKDNQKAREVRDLARARELADQVREGLARKDVEGARAALREMQSLGLESSKGRSLQDDVEREIEEKSASIFRQNIRDARVKAEQGDFEEARTLLTYIVNNSSDTQLTEEAYRVLRDTQKGEEEANRLYRLAKDAESVGLTEEALSSYRRLWTEYRQWAEKQAIGIPVIIGANVDSCDLTVEIVGGEDGRTFESQSLPFKVHAPPDTELLVTLAKEGYETQTRRIRVSFDRTEFYFTIKRQTRWAYDTDGTVEDLVVVAGDVVYAATVDGKVHAIGLADGKAVWPAPFRVSGLASIEGALALAGKILVVPVTDGRVLGLDAGTGEQRWEFSSTSAFRGDAAASHDGATVYVGCDDDKVYALDAVTGTRKHEVTLDGHVQGAIAVAGTRLYVGTLGSSLYCLEASGLSIRWRFPTRGWVLGLPVVIGDDVVFGNRDHRVYRVNADGEQVWEAKVGGPVDGAVGVDGGVVVVGSTDGLARGLTLTNGLDLWVTNPLGKTASTQGNAIHNVLAGGGRAYMGTADGLLVCLETSSGRTLWSFAAREAIRALPVRTGTALLVGTADDQVLAFTEQE